MDRYVPKSFNLKFFRYQLAEYDYDQAERLREITYDKLIEYKWMRRVKTQITIDNMPKPRE